MSDDRKLTKKEQIRKEKAEAVLKEYEEKGFSSRKIVYDVVEANFKDISFGVIWKMLTPYCTVSA